MEEKLFVPKNEVKDFVKRLQKKVEVVAPVKRGEREVVFKKLESYEEPYLNLDYVMSSLPPQKVVFFPSIQRLFEFAVSPQVIITETRVHNDEVVLFGVHVTDLLALAYLDKIMTTPYKDALYWSEREKLVVIGIDYPAHPKAFQPPIQAQKGLFDLFLDDVGEEYQILIGSDKGKKLLGGIPLRRIEKVVEKEPPFKDPILADVEKLKKAVEESRESKLWDEMAEQCIGCGVCTWVCPLCYCFDIRDKVNLNGKGQRERVWDSCLLKDFARIANDVNFRETLKERFYNWYHHKFVRMVTEYGIVGCTGCGRCVAYCPVGISIKKNLVRLVREMEEREQKKESNEGS